MVTTLTKFTIVKTMMSHMILWQSISTYVINRSLKSYIHMSNWISQKSTAAISYSFSPHDANMSETFSTLSDKSFCLGNDSSHKLDMCCYCFFVFPSRNNHENHTSVCLHRHLLSMNFPTGPPLIWVKLFLNIGTKCICASFLVNSNH